MILRAVPTMTGHALIQGMKYRGGGVYDLEEAKHIVECVNACHGFDPKKVGLLLNSMRKPKVSDELDEIIDRNSSYAG